MKRFLIIFAVIFVLGVPEAFADASKLIPPYHWTYHALAALSEKKLIDEKVEPGRTAFTPEQVVSMVIFAMNRIEMGTVKLGADELLSLRQLVNGYRLAFEKSGRDPAKLRDEIEAFAVQAGLPALETNGQPSGAKKLSAEAASAVNRFAFDIYSHAAKNKGSVFLSPYSISSALSMTYAGARGGTAAEMERVLHISPDIHKHMAALTSEMNSVPREQAIVSAANAVWPAKQERLLPEFVQTVREGYRAGIAPLNYKSDPPGAAKTINAWVSRHTEGKINDIISPNALTKQTSLVLTNAVYFKSEWQSKFEPDASLPAPFHVSDSKSVKVMMMHRTGRDVKYIRTENAAIAELPYRDARFSMLVMLPDEKTNISDFEKELTAEKLSKWRAAMKPEYVSLYLPRFRTEASYELSDMLKEMGMPSAFNGEADFSGINGKMDMFIGGVLHKTFIEVGEEGTEAAAATAVILNKMSAPSPETPIEFRADRPFVYIIRDNASGAILFIGRYTAR